MPDAEDARKRFTIDFVDVQWQGPPGNALNYYLDFIEKHKLNTEETEITRTKKGIRLSYLSEKELTYP